MVAISQTQMPAYRARAQLLNACRRSLRRRKILPKYSRHTRIRTELDSIHEMKCNILARNKMQYFAEGHPVLNGVSDLF